jgi:hypothetical protein
MFNDHLLNVINNTNFNDKANIPSFYKKLFQKVYDSLYEESRLYLFILIGVLLMCSLIGSISNLCVVFVFKSVFNKNFNRNIQTQLIAAAYRNETEFIFQAVLPNDYQIRKKIFKLYEAFNNMRNQLIFNSDVKQFYALIRYLALVDFFTCSIVLPMTAYEIWNNMKVNGFNCKLFEFCRAFGVVASNFIIVLIAIERFLALYNLKKYKRLIFRFRLTLAILISIIIAVICMLQVSVFQKIGNVLIDIGVCLKSEYIFKNEYSRIIYLSITSVFAICMIFVSIVYFIIFRKTYEIESRHSNETQTQSELKLFTTSNKHSNMNSVDFIEANRLDNSSRPRDEIEATNDYDAKENKFLCFSLNRNRRIAISILLVTFTYYVSIIPWCLTINNVIEYNPYIHYTFLLNSLINPYSYAISNPNFRCCGFCLLKLKFRTLKF